MHFGPIFRALMYHKARFWLITLEVALTLAIVANCVNMMNDLQSKYDHETGIDEDNIIVLWTEPFETDFRDQDYVDEVRRSDLELLRAQPGVRAAVATHQIPLSGGGSATGRKVLGSELDSHNAPYFLVSAGMIDTLGAELIAGRDFTAADFEYQQDEDGIAVHRPVILSEALANALFPDGNALGGTIQNGNGKITNPIIGIVRKLPNSWPSWQEGRDWTMLLPASPGSASTMNYLIRTEAGALEAVFGSLEPLMLGANEGRILRLETMVENKQQTFNTQLAMVKLLSIVIALLLLVTALGIVGLTAFTVAERRRQIGTRRALGASRGEILGYFLLENWMITGCGLAIGVAMTYGLNYLLGRFAGAPKMPWSLILGGMMVLWITGILAALLPAWRATLVAPVAATRTV